MQDRKWPVFPEGIIDPFKNPQEMGTLTMITRPQRAGSGRGGPWVAGTMGRMPFGLPFPALACPIRGSMDPLPAGPKPEHLLGLGRTHCVADGLQRAGGGLGWVPALAGATRILVREVWLLAAPCLCRLWASQSPPPPPPRPPRWLIAVHS